MSKEIILYSHHYLPTYGHAIKITVNEPKDGGKAVRFNNGTITVSYLTGNVIKTAPNVYHSQTQVIRSYHEAREIISHFASLALAHRGAVQEGALADGENVLIQECIQVGYLDAGIASGKYSLETEELPERGVIEKGRWAAWGNRSCRNYNPPLSYGDWFRMPNLLDKPQAQEFYQKYLRAKEVGESVSFESSLPRVHKITIRKTIEDFE